MLNKNLLIGLGLGYLVARAAKRNPDEPRHGQRWHDYESDLERLGGKVHNDPFYLSSDEEEREKIRRARRRGMLRKKIDAKRKFDIRLEETDVDADDIYFDD